MELKTAFYSSECLLAGSGFTCLGERVVEERGTVWGDGEADEGLKASGWDVI